MKSNKFLTYTIIIGLLGALFIPFIIADTQLFPFITGKNFTFRILVEILFALWIAGMFFDASIRPKMSWLSWSVLAVTGVTFLADIFGHSFYHSFWSNYERMDGFITTLHLAAYYFVASSTLNTKERWKLFFNMAVIASVIMAIYTFFQLAGKIVINQGGVRIDGTFGNATYLAVYMLFSIFITLFLTLDVYEGVKKASNWYWYGWYAVALICQFISLYETATRGAIIGLLGGLILTTIFVAIFEKNRPLIRKMSIGVLVVLVIVIGGFFAIRNSSFVTNSQTLSRFASLSVQSVNTQGRRYVWPMAWQGFKDRPILGWGQENFNYVFNKYYDPRMYNQEPWFDRAHNVILDWLVTTGFVGLLAYLSLFVGALYLIWKSESSFSQKGLLIGLLAGYFFQNIFVFDNLFSYIYFFSILSFIHSAAVRNKSEPAWLARLGQHKALAQITIPAISAIAGIIIIYAFNVQQIIASRDIIQGLTVDKHTPQESLDYFKKAFDTHTFASGEATDQMTGQFASYDNPNIPLEIKQAYAKLLIDNLDEVINRFPDDARYLLSMGSLRVRMGDIQGGVPYLQRALQATPRKQRVYHELGFASLSSNNYDDALKQFKAAYDLDTTSDESKIIYAVGALYAKQDKLANQLVSELSQKPGFFDERILSAYVNTGHPAEAVKILETQVKNSPNDPALRFRLAAGYLLIGQRAKSIAVLQEMLKLFPDNQKEIEYYIKEIQAGRDPTKAK